MLEQIPVIRKLCGTLFIEATKPGARRPAKGELADHESLRDCVSVVIPCRNEASTLPVLVGALTGVYGPYIHEVILALDPSNDGTEEVASQLARTDARVRVLARRPPSGVGLALRDGYAAAGGQYILSIDADFTMLVSELRDLFDVVASGHDGAIGSRFSHDSILLNYPTVKLLGNRAFHELVRLLLRLRIRDVSNNLKLYRAEILRDLKIREPGFAANAETGLLPLLAGYDIKEVPIAWINRSSGMGTSSFRVLKVAPGYGRVLARALRSGGRRRISKEG
jgi:glycosyltransferase involved in cell wall biosynthesis